MILAKLFERLVAEKTQKAEKENAGRVPEETGKMFIIAGLGNPGRKYEKTRHNCGFEALDILAERYRIDVSQLKFKARIGTGVIEGQKVLLMKPQTYMNLSGEAVQAACAWYKADPDEGLGFLRLNTRSDFELSHILGPFRQSTWRLEGGGDTLSRALANGLDIRYQKTVTAIENQVVTCSDGSTFQADYVISDLHPLTTMELVKDHVRRAYTHRLSMQENGPDIFSVHCLMEPDCVPWQSGAIFLDDSLMIHFDEPGTGILELMCFGEGNPEEMIARAATRLPGLKVRKYHCQMNQGYGIVKHSNADFIAAATPLPWLFLTGQNLGLHGILGTSISALNTCKSIEP